MLPKDIKHNLKNKSRGTSLRWPLTLPVIATQVRRHKSVRNLRNACNDIIFSRHKTWKKARCQNFGLQIRKGCPKKREFSSGYCRGNTTMPTKIQVHLFIVRKRRKTQEKFHTIQMVHLMRETSQALPWLVTEKKIMEKLILSAPHHQHEHRVKIVKKY